MQPDVTAFSHGSKRAGLNMIRFLQSLVDLDLSLKRLRSHLVVLKGEPSQVLIRCLREPGRTGDSRGFAFVRYKYHDEAQKAVEKVEVYVFAVAGDFNKLLELLQEIVWKFKSKRGKPCKALHCSIWSRRVG